MSKLLFLFLLVFSLSLKASSLDEDTPVSHDEIKEQEVWSGTRNWKAPDYSGQNKAFGYSENMFQVPAGLEKPVQFWLDIYTKYTTEQGVIHDAESIQTIYEVVDFSEVQKLDLEPRTKEKLKKKIVEEAKERARVRISRVKNAKSMDELSSEDKELYFVRADIEENQIRFQLGQKDRMQTALFLSGRYLEDFERIFREHQLPIELTRLVFVESSFNVLARSKVGASGLWQIMPSTARPFRMISPAVDKRNHPIEATKLAAKVLKMSYDIVNSWPLAIMGYNHGPSGVLRMTQKYKTRDIVELIENVRSRKSFGFASRNFYPSFLAALEVERNALKYFPGLKISAKPPVEPIRTPVALSYVQLLNWFEGDQNRAQLTNPHLTSLVRRGKKEIPSNTWLQIPEKNYPQVLAFLARKKVSESRNKRLVASSKEPQKSEK